MKKTASLICMLLALSVSCQKNELIQTDNLQENDGKLYASIEEAPSSKTSVDADNGIIWSADDDIIAFLKSTKGICCILDPASVGKRSAEFIKLGTATGGEALAHNVACYPYTTKTVCAEGEESGTYVLGVTIPANQKYVAGTFDQYTFPMVAVSDNDELTFKNVCGILKLQLKGSQKVASVKLEGNAGEPVAGSASISAFADGRVPSVRMSDEAEKAITLKCGQGVQLDQDLSEEFLMVVPPVLFNEGFTVTFTDVNGDQYAFKSAKKTEIRRSRILTMPSLTLPEPTTPEVSGDLAENGTANSYIVPAEGSYSFPTVKGNTDEALTDVAAVSVLWETYGNAKYIRAGSLLKNLTYADGKVSFEVADFKEGNAVIAAQNSDGEILWSWHIWFTDYPKSHTYNNSAGIVMDRNLGATSAVPGEVEALGLLYQWGRKDPFLSSSMIDRVDEVTSTITWPSPVEATEEVGNVAYAVSHPTTFIMATEPPYDWHYSSRADGLWASEKTIYDPCPAGWKVPSGGSSGLWKKAGFASGEFSAAYGMEFPISSPEATWYPAAGFLSYAGVLSFTGEYGFYWSSTSMPESSYCYFLRLDSYGSISMTNLIERSYAYSIRCVQDSE